MAPTHPDCEDPGWPVGVFHPPRPSQDIQIWEQEGVTEKTPPAPRIVGGVFRTQPRYKDVYGKVCAACLPAFASYW